MCVEKHSFLHLLDMYPETAREFKDWALIKREVFLHYRQYAE
jgi:hypothetical protein